MAFECWLYNYNKKVNSTKIPGETYAETQINVARCTLKDNTSILHPVFIFKFNNTFSPSVYNYARIISWGRYYYINDWVYDHGVWLAYMSVDVLTSWRTAIGNTSAYVVRSSAAYDEYIIDGMYPLTGLTTSYSSTVNAPFQRNWQDGIFVLGVIGKGSASQAGMTTYYYMTVSQFTAFADYLFGSAGWSGIAEEDLSAGIQKALLNPMQYITSCKWYPIASVDGVTVSEIDLGFWTIPVAATRISSIGLTYTAGSESNLVISKHFQSAIRGAYLNLSPFTRYTLYVPAWGEIPVDTTKIASANKLYFSFTVDLISGNGTLGIWAIDDTGDTELRWRLYTALPATVGVEISLSQLTLDTLGAVQNAVDIGASVVGLAGSAVEYMHDSRSGGALLRQAAGTVSSVTSNIISAVQAQYPDVLTKASQGSIVQFNYPITLTGYFSGVTAENNRDFGRPLCAVKVLKELPGFQLVKNPEIVANNLSPAGVVIPSPTQRELEMITQYLESGYYYE